ncbi:MAG: hypothetical protein U0670_04410 [Anaerolineae bacterium]
MKRLLWIGIPALVLVGLIALNRTLIKTHYIDGGANGTLLYAASFDGDAASEFNAEWEQYEGRLSAEILEGRLRLTIGDANRGSYALSRTWYGDFDVQTQARAIEGPVNNGYGIIFRALDRNNYYVFKVSSDGYYAVQRVLNGQSKYLSNWISTIPANAQPAPELNGVTVGTDLNTVNALRVVAHGNEFAFYINGIQAPLCIPNDPNGESVYYEFYDTPEQRCVQGHMVDTLIDDSIDHGQIGLTAESFDFGDADRAVIVEFDQVLIFAP